RLEDLYDDHTTAAVGAWRSQVGRGSGVLELSWCRHSEQLAGARDIVFAVGASEGAVVTDTMETLRPNVEQKEEHEIDLDEGHDGLALVSVAAIVLVSERDPGVVERNQPVVRDGDAVGVSRQIGEHGFWPGERRLGVDEPPLIAERPQVAAEGTSVAQASVV